MKTIREGDLLYNQPWYVKVSFECDRCGWIGRPEHKNEVTARNRDAAFEVYVMCPTCHQRVVNRYEGVNATDPIRLPFGALRSAG